MTASPASAPLAGLGEPAPRWFDRGAANLADRIPLFGEAMAAVAAAWTDGFGALTATPALFTFKGLTESRVAGLAARRGRDPVFVSLDAPGWRTTVGLQFDRAFVSSVLEALFGGDDAAAEDAPTGPLTPVERRIAEVIGVQAGDALRQGFADALPSRFPFERVQPKPDLAFLGRPNAGVAVATLRLQTLGRTSEIDVLVSRSALDGFADRLAVLPDDEPQAVDPRWSERLGGQVSRAPMSLTAVVDLDTLTLGALARLRPGQVLALPRTAAADVRLVCEGRDLFRCDLGQSAGLYTVRIGEAADPSSPKEP